MNLNKKSFENLGSISKIFEVFIVEYGPYSTANYSSLALVTGPECIVKVAYFIILEIQNHTKYGEQNMPSPNCTEK